MSRSRPQVARAAPAAAPPETLSVVLPPIRVTPSQRLAYEEAAARAGVGLSEWLRTIASREAERAPAK